MSFNTYYSDELSALRELGKEFAERNPRLAPLLTQDGQDPDVERLLEGVAFLTGRLRQKLDDELPEITHSLMALMWPHFLRPIPAMSILSFSPLPTLSEKQDIKKGVEVLSKPVDGTACTFRTCYDVTLYPIDVVAAGQHKRPTGASLSIKFALTTSITWRDLKIERLPIYLHGEVRSVQALYLWINRYLERVQVVANTKNGSAITMGDFTEEIVRPEGFDRGQNLLPASPHLLNGVRLVQEYYALPEKFHFVAIERLDCIENNAKLNDDIANAETIEVQFHFSRPLQNGINVTANNFQLFCTPIVNLFQHDATPIRADYKKAEYRVMPSGRDASHYEVFDIVNVSGWGHRDHQNQLFDRFESLDHYESSPVDNHKRYYRERQKPSVSGYGLDSYLSFVNQYEYSVFPETETISMELICTNRHLPTLLNAGDICMDTATSPEYATFENITYVTPSFAPPLDKSFHWRLISNMSLNYMTLTDPKSLKAVLSTYDYKSYYDRQQALANQHRLDAIADIASTHENRIYKGSVVRGRKTVIRLNESGFASEGDMYLLASVFNELFAMNCSINSFHHLLVYGVENGEIYEWKPRTGSHLLV